MEDEKQPKPIKLSKEIVKLVLDKYEIDLSEEALQFINKGAIYLMKCHRSASALNILLVENQNKLIMLNQSLEKRIAELEGKEYKP